MDILYAVKQLDREIAFAESALDEKKKTRDALAKALSPQDKALADDEKSKIRIRPGPPAAK